MYKRIFRYSTFLTIAALLMVAGFSSAPVKAADELPFEVVASGLDNPRGLAFAPRGALYIVEAGRGGNGVCQPDPDGDGQTCFGLSGAITRVWKGEQTRVVTGLPSHAEASGFGATGPHDLVLHGNNIAFVVVGSGGTPAFRDAFGPEAAELGNLLQVKLKKGAWESVADFLAYEANTDSDGNGVDSNPYGLLSGDWRIVVDAGGNDLLRVEKNGQVSTLAVFPDRLADAPPFLGLPPGTQIPMQSVPTTVAQSRDHRDRDDHKDVLYVGELTGFPFPVGGARIYKVIPGHDPEVFAEGFTHIIDMEFSPRDGRLYVLEIAANGLLSNDLTGALIRVDPDGSQTVIASEGLVAPGGLTFGPGGAAYVTNFSIFPGEGQVVRIPIESKGDKE